MGHILVSIAFVTAAVIIPGWCVDPSGIHVQGNRLVNRNNEQVKLMVRYVKLETMIRLCR